jgi:hypothetical protein
MFDDVNKLIEQARTCEQTAEQLLAEALPPGTVVTFRFGNMTTNGNGEVVRTEVFHYPEVTVKNLFTGKVRRVPLDAIQGF